MPPRSATDVRTEKTPFIARVWMAQGSSRCNRWRARRRLGRVNGYPALINGSADCQRVALLSYFKATLGQDDGRPVEHPISTTALLLKTDVNLTILGGKVVFSGPEFSPAP